MQPLPSIFRQSLRSGISLARTSCLRPTATAFHVSNLTRSSLRSRTICIQCQFKVQYRLYSSKGEEVLSGRQSLNPEFSSGDVEQRADQGEPMQAGLPSEAEGRRSQLSKQLTGMMDNLQSNVFIAGQRLNDLTGYSAIEKLKREIEAQEAQLRASRALVRQAKEAYSAAISRRSASQREVNELLQRKHTWSPADLERFTALYRSDHANEVTEIEAQDGLSAAERQAEEAAAVLNKSILSRYHEEQIWSDKIRRMSTWGTWGLMGVNVLLFLIFQVAIEPWRRQRLVKGFEEKVKEAIEGDSIASRARAINSPSSVESAVLANSPSAEVSSEAPTHEKLENQALSPEFLPPNVETSADPTIISESKLIPSTTNLMENYVTESPLPEFLPRPGLSLESRKLAFYGLFSERKRSLTQRDLTIVVIKSSAAGIAIGAAVMGLVFTLIRPH
ncbi:hypothetical protein Egran_00882 [Elaphomyces granulatus]|uniref:Sensitive to high expression protein 9, mitochondrial n=1 Tax=Elaphomyces granulatus TaxID=519963 RepID=A0A232M4K6_9EURO|nr:hypothetical protein Egran_00882 [Elaphomyces granulatus]